MASSVFRGGLLLGKSALVTGGGSGIGKSIARELLGLGCNVVIASRKVAKLEAAVEELQAAAEAGRGKVALFRCDIRKEEEVEAMVKFVVDTFGSLDFVVNNAGGQFPSPAGSITARGWRTVVDLNLNGTFLVCRSAFDHWMFEHGGSIVNVIATYHNGFPMMAHTGAARAGVANLTQTLATEWASCGIRVNAVAPGIVFSDSAQEHYRKNGGLIGEDPLTRQAPFIPAKRLASTEEVSSCVTFLLSPGASYVTGCVLKVDGGYTLLGQGDFHTTLPDGEPENFPRYGTLPEPLKSKL